jgi:hypothetical protein
MFLTPDELADLTGYKHREKQKAALRSMGYVFTVRPLDGRVLVLRTHVESRHGGKPGRGRREPDFTHLEAAQ